MKVKVSLFPLSVTPWTIQSMEFSRPEYWRGWPFPSPGDLPNPGIELKTPILQADSLPAELPVKVKGSYDYPKKKKCYENVTNEGLGMNMYTLIYTELMIKKSVLNCTGKSTEHDVTTSVRKTTQKRINLYV